MFDDFVSFDELFDNGADFFAVMDNYCGSFAPQFTLFGVSDEELAEIVND